MFETFNMKIISMMDDWLLFIPFLQKIKHHIRKL